MSSGVVIKIEHINDGFWTCFDGQYLVEYDPRRPGADAEGNLMDAHLLTTPNKSKARVFATVKDALALWEEQNGLRSDGEPNCPLTAFTVSLEAA